MTPDRPTPPAIAYSTVVRPSSSLKNASTLSLMLMRISSLAIPQFRISWNCALPFVPCLRAPPSLALVASTPPAEVILNFGAGFDRKMLQPCATFPCNGTAHMGGTCSTLHGERGPHSRTNAFFSRPAPLRTATTRPRRVRSASSRRPPPRTPDRHNFVAESESTNSSAYRPD